MRKSPCLTPDGTSKTTEWETPILLFKALDAEFHFVCDVAALPSNAKCPTFFTPDDDALTQDWPRGACWLNPPYGRILEKFVRKALEESRRGSTVVVLIPTRTSNAWWCDTVPHAAEIRFIRGRIRFVGAPDVAPFPSALLVFTPEGGPPTVKCITQQRPARQKKKIGFEKP